MYSEETTQELDEIICCQKEKISKLNKKLEEFDAVISERDTLRDINKQFQENYDYITNGHKKAFDDLSATCNEQTENIKKMANAEYQWELKYGKLEDDNNCINREINILKCNESKLQSQLDETETDLKSVQKELCTTKTELEEKNCMVSKLKTNLKCNEQELYNVRRELEDSKTEWKKLNETNEDLNSDLRCTKKCLYDTKMIATRMEEKCTQDRETLTNELKVSCKKINELEIQYDEAMCKLNDERCKSKKFSSKLIDLNRVSARNNAEMKNRTQQLQDEIGCKNNELCCLKKRVCELQQDNDCKCMEINGLQNKLHDRECQLKRMCLISEKIDRVKCFVDACCCPKNPCEPNPCCCPKKPCEPNPPCCPKKKCGPSPPCCPKKKCKANPCCPKKKCEPNPCPKKKCEPSPPCCPKKKCEPSPCCPKKKPETICCKLESACSIPNNTKAVVQKCGSNQDMYKMELQKLKCELEDLQQTVGYIS